MRSVGIELHLPPDHAASRPDHALPEIRSKMKHFVVGFIIGFCIIKCITFDWTPSASTAVGVQSSCTEDSWCWNPLINGNHFGYVTVLQNGES